MLTFGHCQNWSISGIVRIGLRKTTTISELKESSQPWFLLKSSRPRSHSREGNQQNRHFLAGERKTTILALKKLSIVVYDTPMRSVIKNTFGGLFFGLTALVRLFWVHVYFAKSVIFKQWKKEQVWPFFGYCTADSQTDAGIHQLYNNGSLDLLSTACLCPVSIV